MSEIKRRSVPRGPVKGHLLSLVMGLLVATPVFGVAIEVATFALPATNAGSGFRTVPFNSTVFQENGVTPLVFVIPTNAGGHPCNFRLAAVRQDGFDIACVEPPGHNGPHTNLDLHYIAIEPGVHSIPATVGGSATTVTMAAGSVATTAVQHGCATAAACGTEGAASITFGTTFGAAPSLLLRIQGLASESGTPPGTVSTPFLTATVVEDGAGAPIISTSGADVALERSEVQQGTVSAETIGWLAVAPTAGCTTLDFSSFGGPVAVPFEAINTGEVIDGWTDGCNAGEGATFSAGCFAATPVVVATKRTRNEDDGGWLRRCTAGFDTSAVRFTVDEDNNTGAGNEGDGERSHVDEAASVLAFGLNFSTPVSLASFASEATPEGVLFRWTTATEVGTVGFHLREKTAEGWRPLTQKLIPSRVVDSVALQTYEVEVVGAQGREFRLEDYDTRSRKRVHGPFELGRKYGRAITPKVIDWAAVRRAEEQRRARRQAEVRQRGVERAALRIRDTGFYRVSYEELRQAGLDLSGVPAKSLALTSRGIPRSRRVLLAPGAVAFGPGAEIEFYGEAITDSLYTRTNVFYLEVDPAQARAMVQAKGFEPAAPLVSTYLARLVVEEDRAYSFASPLDDPWYDRRLLAQTEPLVTDFELPVEDLVSEGAGARLDVRLWGGTDFPVAPDHRVEISLNGELLWSAAFDGLAVVEPSLALPAGLLREGVNRLTLTLPGDTGVPFDLVHLESYALTYPRHLQARGDALRFTAAGGRFRVAGWRTPPAAAYRLEGRHPRRPVRLPFTVAAGDGSLEVTIPGRREQQFEYHLLTGEAFRRVDSVAPAPRPDLPQGHSRLTIIGHASLLPELDPLVAARQAEGYSVSRVDVADLYAAYTHGIVDPDAIRSYLREAVADRGTEFVLLAGGDSYDYLDHSGLGSLSFVPTIYTATDELIRFSPSDALLGDVDGDGFPDLAIGRLPARTPEELRAMVRKTLDFGWQGPRRTALFAADDAEAMTSFAAISDRLLAGALPPDWRAETVYLDDLAIDAARHALLAGLDRAPALASFIGHSGPTVWTFDGLFSAADVAGLSNPAPMVLTQWGCWNTYFVAPAYDTLAHALLLDPEHGAAAVLGASTLTTVESERLLAQQAFGRMLTPGEALGRALQQAKEELRRSHPERLDVLLGWTLLGDPTLVLNP
ncbi:MAG: C25 family cysteine peptidase [Acidobacteriota bacterium]